MKKYLIILRNSPYSNSQALESLEFALAVCAFNQQVSLLFKDAGVLQLLKQQQPQDIASKNFTKAYAGLNLFGIEAIYIDEQSVDGLDYNDLIMQPQLIKQQAIVDLIAAHDIVWEL